MRIADLVERLQSHYDFQCPVGPLRNCVEWVELCRLLSAPVRAEEPTDTERLLRIEWFMNHGDSPYGDPDVHARYGDDGEMQCCMIDFRRMPLAQLKDRVDLGRSRQIVRLASSLPPVQEPPTPEGPGATRSHRFDCDECQVRGVVVDEDGCCKGCGHDARMVPSPSQGVRLDDWKCPVCYPEPFNRSDGLMCEKHPGQEWMRCAGGPECAGPGMPWVIRGRRAIESALEGAATKGRD